jgi:hypothetical protein
VTIKVLQEAQLEFLVAISHYEAERPGLGQRFNLDSAVELTAENARIAKRDGYESLPSHRNLKKTVGNLQKTCHTAGE